MAVTIADLDYGNRTPSEFIAATIIASGVHNNYSVYDGVKDKQQIPIFDGSLVFGNDLCTFDPQSVATIDEKEFVTENYKWAFKNCKTALQRSYRSLMLKKGANNAETMDSQFKDWMFDYFAKLAGKEVGKLATAAILAEIATDASVIKDTSADLADSADATTVLPVLATIFQSITEEMYQAHFNPNGVIVDQAVGLSMILPWEIYRAAHVALSTGLTNTMRAEIEAGAKPLRYMGIDLYLDPELPANKVLVAPLDNFVIVVDDMADIDAIQVKYIEELSSDYIWGQFTIGFGYKKSDMILEYTLT